MSGLLRSLKSRIRSVENTKKITRAMEMVAAAKLRKYQDMMLKGRDYAVGLETLLKRLSSGETPIKHPFVEIRDITRIGVVVFTSDTGLCGSYNLDLVTRAEAFIKKQTEAPVVYCVGKFGANALKRHGIEPKKIFKDTPASKVEAVLQELKSYLEQEFLSGAVDAIHVVYSSCLSMTSFEDVTQKLLPLDKPESGEDSEASKAAEYIFEPDPEVIIGRLVPLFFEARTRQIFLESFVSEQIARMRAMHQATENAKEMIDALVLQRNKVRQAAITKEIIEIVSGSQAAKN